jgi:hypothetical protein
VKASKATIAARVEELAQVIVDGCEAHEVCRYVADRETEEGSPWFVAEGEKPLSARQIRRYARLAEQQLAESLRTSRGRLVRKHISRRRNLYAKAVAAGDLRTALATLDSEARLLALDQPLPAKPAGDQPATPAAVVEILARRLASIDQTKLPAGEQARLTATLAEALLRATSAADLEKQVAELAARVEALVARGKRRGE